MSEVAEVTQKPTFLKTISKLFGKKESGPSDEELSVSALNHYIERLSSLNDSPLRGDGQTIKDSIRSLVIDFEEEKKKDPSLTESVFVEKKANGRNLVSIASQGWNSEDSHLRSFSHDQPITKDRTWNFDRVVGDLLGEGFVDLDTRFKKSESPFFGSDNVSWEGKAEKPSVGVDRYNGTFSQWFAGVTNEKEKSAGISVAVKREDKAKLWPHAFLTGHEGGVRAYSISISNKTITSVIRAESAKI